MAVLSGIHTPSASAKTLHHTCPAFSGDFEYLFVGTTTGDVAVVGSHKESRCAAFSSLFARHA